MNSIISRLDENFHCLGAVYEVSRCAYAGAVDCDTERPDCSVAPGGVAVITVEC